MIIESTQDYQRAIEKLQYKAFSECVTKSHSQHINKWERHPKYLFVGDEQFEVLMACASYQVGQSIEPPKMFEGLEIVRVDRSSFLAVG